MKWGSDRLGIIQSLVVGLLEVGLDGHRFAAEPEVDGVGPRPRRQVRQLVGAGGGVIWSRSSKINGLK